MKFYRCLICGEVYMGESKPTNCPFCGVHEKYLTANDEWVDENLDLGELSETSHNSLEKALQLEVNNSPFYRDAMSNTSNLELQGIFKYLSKIEGEHASTIRKILKCDLLEPEEGKEVAFNDDRANLEAAHAREVAATAFYNQAASEATEKRVKKVFLALSEVEADHIQLESDLLQKLD